MTQIPQAASCQAAKSWTGISIKLGCYRNAGHPGLHKDLLGIWWASTDNRTVNHDGLTGSEHDLAQADLSATSLADLVVLMTDADRNPLSVTL